MELYKSDINRFKKNIYGNKVKKVTVDGVKSIIEYYENEINKLQKSVIFFSNLWFQTKEETEYVLNSMKEIIANKGFVNDVDLYDLANVFPWYCESHVYWSDLKDAKIKRNKIKNIWFLDLPKPKLYKNDKFYKEMC